MKAEECFSPTYEAARSKFISVCQASGARMAAYVNPNGKTPDGEALVTDTAWFGRPDAARVLLVFSGTHGQEFFAGAATQIGWVLQERHRELPNDTAVLLVHAVNPFGAAHMSRTTENNVDPNRNFLDHDLGHYTDPDFELCVDVLRVAEPSETEFQRVKGTLDDLFDRHGKGRIFALTSEGQFAHPKLSGFAGLAPEWTNDVVHSIVSEQLSGADHVAAIDWHSGVGESQSLLFLCFDEPGSPAFRRASQWWGEDTIADGVRNYGDHERPQFRGLLVNGVREMLQARYLASAVIEFGTHPWDEVCNAILVDQWLRFGKGAKSEADLQHWRTFMLERFCPHDTGWRAWALEAGLTVYDQAIGGLAQL